MIEQGLYFSTADFHHLVRSCGGEWADTKDRPLVCLVRALDNPQICWAIPMGDMAHRTQEQRSRIERYLSLPSRDIRSCYYHIAMTDKESLFFISDTVPITDKYIERAYLVGNNPYVIKNKNTCNELRRKLARILSFEKHRPNGFRQHITAIKEALIAEQE